MATPKIGDFLTPDGGLSDVWFRHFDKIGDVDTLTDKVTTLSGDVWSWFVEFPDDKDYDFIINLPYAGSINSVTTISSTGTCTFTGKINTTALGGTANSVSSTESEQAHTTANAFIVGDNFRGTVSSNSGCENMTVTVKVTRTI